MKKIALVIIASLSIFVVNAQISKGSTFLGGSVNFNASSTEDDAIPSNENKINEWGIRPQFGKAIATNKILGIFLNFAGSTNEYMNSSFTSDKRKVEGNNYGGGIFYRQYYPISNRFYLFGDGSLGVNFGKSEATLNNAITNEQKYTGLRLGVTPGISFAISNKLHIEAAMNDLLTINYQSSETKEFNSSGSVIRTSKGNAFAGGANSNGFNGLAIGLRWILPSTTK